MANETPKKKHDNEGTPEPGFGGEGQRSELGDGNPIDPKKRERFAEHNRQVEKEKEREPEPSS